MIAVKPKINVKSARPAVIPAETTTRATEVTSTRATEVTTTRATEVTSTRATEVTSTRATEVTSTRARTQLAIVKTADLTRPPIESTERPRTILVVKTPLSPPWTMEDLLRIKVAVKKRLQEELKAEVNIAAQVPQHTPTFGTRDGRFDSLHLIDNDVFNLAWTRIV